MGKKLYRLDYDGLHDSDYIWCNTDEDAIKEGKEIASKGIYYADIGHCELELIQIVEVDDESEFYSEKRVIWY